jgi:DNA-binding LytR/AlgR family response regulator
MGCVPRAHARRLLSPGLTGIEVAQRIRGHAHIVFVTTHGDHALAAFDAASVDYVLKPIDTERLAHVCARVEARLASPEAAPPDLQTLNQLIGQVRKPAPLEAIQAGVGKDVRLVRLDEVIWFESDGRYTRVVCSDAQTLVRTPLKELLAQLDPSRFWQVHRSVVVSERHIASAVRIDEGTMVLTLRGRDEKLPVSRHFQSLFPAQ